MPLFVQVRKQKKSSLCASQRLESDAEGNMSKPLLSFLLALVLVVSLAADPQMDAIASMARKDYAADLELVRPLALKGEAWAQSELGFMYENGYGVPQDYTQAMIWFRKAADQGDARAQNNLGVMHAKGEGVPRDYSQAMIWFRKAADQGYARAQNNLGRMYHKISNWTDQAAAGSRNWWSIAMSADGTHLAAVDNQGGDIWTSSDSGATWTDQAAAGSRYWNSIAMSADGTHLAAVDNRGDIWTSSDSGATWTDQAAAGSRTWWFIAMSADGTHLAAAEFGGGIWTYPYVGPLSAGPLEDAGAADARKDYATELTIVRPLAIKGEAWAQSALGFMYENGYGVPQDYAQALTWYRKAADQGAADAQCNLGHMYENGEGVPQDYIQAHMWLNLAASRYSTDEKYNRDQAIANRDRVAGEMTPEQIAKAQKLASEWKPATPTYQE